MPTSVAVTRRCCGKPDCDEDDERHDPRDRPGSHRDCEQLEPLETLSHTPDDRRHRARQRQDRSEEHCPAARDRQHAFDHRRERCDQECRNQPEGKSDGDDPPVDAPCAVRLAECREVGDVPADNDLKCRQRQAYER